jgi:competence protein ComEC
LKRPLLTFVIGGVFGMAIASSFGMLWIAIAGSGAGMLAYLAAGGRAQGLATALLAAAAVTMGGGWFERFETIQVSLIPLPNEAVEEARLKGKIVTPPELDGDRAVFDLLATSLEFQGRALTLPKPERVKVYVRFETEEERDRTSMWKRSDEMTLNGELKRPMPATNFGGFDYREYLRQQRTFWTLHVKGIENASAVEGVRWTPSWLLSWVDRLRESMSERVDAVYSQPVSGFMKGLLIGMRDDLDPEQFQAFSQIGLTHILAISGLHVGIYAGTLLWLLGRLPLTRERRLVLVMAAVPVYVVVTGASPSVLRAGIMAVIALYAARRNLLKDGLHVLSAAAMLMLAWNPFYLYNVSFQLSFAVTAGLIIGVPLMNEWVRIKHPVLQSAISVTLVAQLVSFPLTITYFNAFSLVSFPANLILVPLFSMAVLPLGSISLLLSYAFPQAAPFAAWGAERLVFLSFQVIEWMNGFEGASTIWATPPLWWIALYYALLYACGASLKGRLRMLSWPKHYIAIPCAAALIGLLVYAYAPNSLDRSATVAFLDVGQGDAIWIRTPYGKQALIDGGGTIRFGKPADEWKQRRKPFEVGADVVVPLLKRRGVHALDAVFVSHLDTDHIGGLQAVLEHIPVRRMFFNGTVKRGETSERLLRTALEKGIPLAEVAAGMTIRLDPVTDIQVLYPEAMPGVPEEAQQNEVSVVFLLTVYSRKFLFTGDIGAAEERAIVERLRTDGEGNLGGDGNNDDDDGAVVDVIKLAHHGSKTSTTQEWLDYWKADVAVVSVGRSNVYGHPHAAVIDRIDRARLMTFRTDTGGEIQFRITPSSFQVRTKKDVE